MKPVPRWFVGASWVMAALLVVCVVLQYNDPDPIRWMAIYGAGAVLAALLPSKKSLAPVAVVVALVALVWATYLVYKTWGVIDIGDLTGKMSEKGGAVEEGREAGGLGIAGAWLLFAGVFRRSRS